jgi:membrane fusion protein, heavy metal efflux system
MNNAPRNVVVALCAVILGLCVGCGSGKKVEMAHPFVLTDTMMSHLVLDTVRTAAVKAELMLTGKVVADQDNVVEVYPLVGGEAEEVTVELGDYVQKGQTLAIIRSGEIADFEQQLTSAKSNLSSAKKNFMVTEDMFKSKLVSEKEYINAKEELAKAKGEVTRVDEIFKIYNIKDGSEYVVKAPISGFIVEKNITRGTQLRPDHSGNIFTVSQLHEVWVLADVYESDIANVKVGYNASVTTLSYPDSVFRGRIDKIYNVLDPVSKVMKVRIRLDNEAYLLKPEMFANVTIDYFENSKKASITSQAVIFDKNRNFVMVYRSRSDVETREVNIYKVVNGTTYVESGLHDGEQVISQYHLLVYDALND